ncbi:MAG: hypothetical protein LM580_04450 [Thermofilum sp.]|nr:hypothetical protein [Thermofilum sp.]
MENLEKRLAILAACLAVATARRRPSPTAQLSRATRLNPWPLLARLEEPDRTFWHRSRAGWRGRW